MSSDLRQTLHALHTELGGTQHVDPELRALLITVLGDITKLLEQPSHHETGDAPLAERLESVAIKFEAEHPALGTAIRQVVDTLGKAGI
jgi:Domain of unknown function (DUF4404)